MFLIAQCVRLSWRGLRDEARRGEAQDMRYVHDICFINEEQWEEGES